MVTASSPTSVPPCEPAPASIPARFAQVASRHAKRIAISTPDTEWAYAELDQRSNVLARAIVNRTGSTSEPVALLMDHTPPLIAAILGVLKAGRIYVALDPAEPEAQLVARLNDSRARFLLTDRPNAARARSLASAPLHVEEIDDFMAAPSASVELCEVPLDAGAWLVYTSGSFGVPKGVWQSHRGVVHHADVYAELIHVSPDDRFSLLTSCALAASATPLFGALLSGATLCPFHVRSQGVERLRDWLHQQRITVYHSVPTVFRHLLRTPSANRCLGSLRFVRLGGEPVLRTDVESYRRHCPPGCRLMHALSSTETGLLSALIIDHQTTLPGRRVPVGRAVRGVALGLVDEDGKPITGDRPGRISARSAHLAQGYWLRPDSTAEAFRPDPGDPRQRVFVSGDVGQFLPDGSLEHMGRVDQQVKIRGHRVELTEVEAALRATDLADEAAVMAHDYASGERRLVAYVVPRVGVDASPQACRRALRTSLPDHKVPDDFVVLARLPQTGGGKVDRQALLPPFPSVPRAHSRQSPRDWFEKQLAEIWEEALGVARVGRSDDFFDLGGTSVQSLQVLTRVEDIFNLTLPTSALVEHSTLEQLAAVLAGRAVSSSASPLVLLRPSPHGRPLFLVHGGRGDVAMFGQLARRLPNRPIYGLQAVGLDGGHWPLMSVRAMARRYLRDVLAKDPIGPWLLVGACMGGLTALQMAQLLSEQGRSVGLLGMVDTDHPAAGAALAPSVRRLADEMRDLLRIVRWSAAHAGGIGRTGRWLPAYRRFVYHMNVRARRTYRPVPYPGTITLFLASDAAYSGEDLRAKMSCCARETRTIAISGQKGRLFAQPAVNELARNLQICLEEVERSRAS